MGAESVSWRPAWKAQASPYQSTAGRSGTTRISHPALHTELGEAQDSRLLREEALSQLSSPPYQRNQKSVKGPNTILDGPAVKSLVMGQKKKNGQLCQDCRIQPHLTTKHESLHPVRPLRLLRSC